MAVYHSTINPQLVGGDLKEYFSVKTNLEHNPGLMCILVFTI